MDGFQHFHYTFRLAAVQVVDVEDDPVDRRDGVQDSRELFLLLRSDLNRMGGQHVLRRHTFVPFGMLLDQLIDQITLQFGGDPPH